MSAPPLPTPLCYGSDRICLNALATLPSALHYYVITYYLPVISLTMGNGEVFSVALIRSQS